MKFKEYDATVKEWLKGAYRERLRPAEGSLDHPYVDPGAAYTGVLWEWDAYFSCVGFASLADADGDIGLHGKGCVDNLMAYQGKDGSVPYNIMVGSGVRPNPEAVRDPKSPQNSSKPLLAQFALLVTDRLHGEAHGADAEWLKGHAQGLAAHIDHWFASQGTEWGVLTWRSHRGSGADNHPAYFQRPHNSVADPYLNSLMYRELLAMAEISRRIGEDDAVWTKRAEELARTVNETMWDPIDGTYYCIDVGQGDPGPVRTPSHWTVPLKFRAWSMCMPLYAGIAPPERAKSVIENFLLTELRSPYGVYSLSPREPAYKIYADFNPSDWLGPVWVVSSYLAFRALMNYGYQEEALSLAERHLACLAKDYGKNGCLHEYYHPETGEGLTHPGFVNWNSCASLFASELKNGHDTTLWVEKE